MRAKFDKHDLRLCLKHLISCSGQKSEAAELAFREMPVMRSKAAVSGSTHSDLSSSYVSYMGGEFLNYLDNRPGAFEYFLSRAINAAFNQRLFIPSAGIDGQVVPENASVPVGSYSLTGSAMTPTKTSALALTSKESLADSAEGLDWLLSELRQGIIKGTDSKALALIKAACTPGSATASPTADFLTLLNAVNKTGTGDLVFILSAAIANYLSTKTGSGGNFLFPDLGPQGGIICGTPAIVSPGQVVDEITLVDCSGLLVGAQEVDISLAQSAMIAMDSAPTGDSQNPTGESKALISCFQCDAVAAKATRSFGLSVPRISAVAVLENISWS